MPGGGLRPLGLVPDPRRLVCEPCKFCAPEGSIPQAPSLKGRKPAMLGSGAWGW